MMRRVGTLTVIALAVLSLTACATSRSGASTAMPAAPRYPDYPQPTVPADLAASEALGARQAGAWAQLQRGDLRGARQQFSGILNETPSFYPAAVGLGFTYLAEQNYTDAESWFGSAVSADDEYLPGWVGRAEALLSLGRDDEAVQAMERALLLDDSLDGLRTRVELLRFRLTQSAIGAGLQARAAGRNAEAVVHLQRALAQSPQSTMILNELARAEIAVGQLGSAETHARLAVEVEPQQAEWQALLGDVFEADGRLRAAAEAYGRADALDPGGSWTQKSRELEERATLAELPVPFRAISSAPSVTRGDVAAFTGVHLAELVERAPARVTTVATDVRTHWAAPWILPVTRAGIMSVFPNHTFQPAAVVRRGDLATTMAVLLQLVGERRQADLARWRAARPGFVDLPATNVFYSAAALSAAAGVMAADAAGRFEPTRPATGPELEEAVRRIEALLGQ